MTREELKQIKNERDEMEKHMTDMFDLAFMINNHDDLAKSQEHHEKLSRMVTHYMGSIQQSYGYMSEKAIKALEREPCEDCISRQAVIDIVNNPLNIRLDEIIKKLPPVTPQPKTGH